MAPSGVRPRRRYAELGALGRAILPAYIGCLEFPLVAALAAYIDDSSEPGVFVLAGYVGRVAMWDEAFAPAWTNALASGAHEVSEFKASDCRGKRGEFLGWEEHETRALTSSLVDVLTVSTPKDDFLGIGAATFHRIPLRSKRERRYAEEQCFSACLYHILFDVMGLCSTAGDSPIDIQLVLDNKEGFVERTMRAFHAVQKKFSPKFDGMPLPIFRDSKEVSALQAADLLAYETRKEAKSRVDGKGLEVSMALQRLAESRFHRARCIHWDTLVEAQRRIRAGLSYNDLLTGGILFESESPWRSAKHWPHAR